MLSLLSKMEDILDELKIVTIPAGVEAHLFDWKNKKIADQHFVLTGDVEVLVRKNYGPVYSLLEKYVKSGDIIDDFKSYLLDLYHSKTSVRGMTDSIVSDLRHSIGEDVDAVLMAVDQDRIGLLYLHEGEKPDITYLQ